MTEDVSAGRLHIDAYVDTTGVTRGMQRRLDAEMARANIRAKIKVAIDTRGAVGEARKAAAEATKAAQSNVRIKVRMAVDRTGLAAEVRAAAKEASEAAKVSVKIGLDAGSVAATQAATAAAIGDTHADVEVDADTAKARAELAAFRASQSRNPVTIPVKIDKSAGTALMQLSKIPLLVGGFYTLGSAIVSVGGGLVAMTASAASAAGALAAIPNLVGIAAQSIGVLVAGFSGVGDAVTALGAAEDAAAQSATDYATATENSARAVADAQQNLANARRAAANSARASAEAIEDAEWSLARAQEAARDAQEGLNEAREAARDRIRDLNYELRMSAGEEEAAVEALKLARENLQDVKWDKASSDQERRAAELAVKQAERDLKDTKRRNKDLADEAKEANREGVEGSEEVKDAKDAVRDANHNVQESEEALADARRQAADSARASAQAIASAQRALTDARKADAEATAAQSAEQTALNEAMDNLSPAGQRFAKFLAGTLLPRLKEMRFAIQEAILPGIQTGVERSLPLLDTLQRGLVGTARRIGGFAANLGTLFGRKTFNDDVAKIMRSNNRALGDFLPSIKNLIRMFKDIAVVAGPTLVEPFAKWVRQLTRGWQESAKLNRKSGEMADWFDKVRGRVVMLKNIIANLGDALFGLGKAASPTGDSLLGTFESVTARWAKWANSDLGQARMREFFEAVEPVTQAFGDLIVQVAELFVKLSEGGASPLTAFLTTLTRMVEGVTWLIDTIPGLGTFIGWFMVLAGVGGAIGMVGGMLLKMVANIGKVARVLRPFLKFLSGIGRVLLWVALKVAPMVGRAVAVMFGPWGIAIALVVGAFILLYQRVEWFRKAVHWVMDRVVDAFNWVVDGAMHLWDVLFGHSVFPDIMKGLEVFGAVVATIMGLVVGAFRKVAKGAKWLWTHAIKPAFRAIGRFIDAAWNKVIKPVFKFLWGGLKEIGRWVNWLWKNVMKPVWGFIGKAIQFYWNRVIKPVFKFLWTGLKEIGRWAKWLWENAIRPAWRALSDAIDFAWNKVIKPAFSAFRKFIAETLPNAFDQGVQAIKNFWDDLKNAAKVPIKFVVDTLWNEGLRKMINAIPGVPDMDPISTSSWARGTAAVLPGYTPGRDVHSFFSPTAGRLNLSGGEGIIRPEIVRAIGPKAVDILNRAARSGKKALSHALGALTGQRMGTEGGTRMSSGGVYRAVGRTLSFFNGGVLPLDNATSINPHALPYYGTGASYAADLNSPYDLSNPPSAVRAWLGGQIAHVYRGYGDSHGRYGNHVAINHPDGSSSWYAHLSSLMARVGQSVIRGQMLGRVGETGNADGAHLHFEIRGGSAAVGGVTGSGSAEAENKWASVIGAIKDVVTKVPGWLGQLNDKMGPWAGMMKKAAQSIGGKVRDWVNGKVPGPGPIPSLFDRGGAWRSGVLGLNLSGSTETVFTNTDMVELGSSLRATAVALRSMYTDAPRSTGGGPLVGELTLVGRDEERPAMLRDMTRELRKISLGGVHARRSE